MAINIKDPEAEKVVRDLATLTGESLTHTIKVAVKERFEREYRLRDRDERYRKAKALIDKINEGIEVRPPIDHEYLYDEEGLPKS